LRAAVDSDARPLTIDYDLSRISDKAVQGIAERREARRRLDKCLMRLRGRASNAATPPT